MWQWKNDAGTWETYADEDSELIERLHKSGVKKLTTDKFTFSLFGTTRTEYELDFDKLQQTNLDSKTQRRIRRSESIDDDGGFASLMKAKSGIVRKFYRLFIVCRE